MVYNPLRWIVRNLEMCEGSQLEAPARTSCTGSPILRDEIVLTGLCIL